MVCSLNSLGWIGICVKVIIIIKMNCLIYYRLELNQLHMGWKKLYPVFLFSGKNCAYLYKEKPQGRQ